MASADTKPVAAPSTAALLREKLKGFTAQPTDAAQMSIVGAEPGLAYRIIDLTGRGDVVALARARWAREGWTRLADLRPVHESVVGVPLAELWVAPIEFVVAAELRQLEAAITDPGRRYIQIADGCPHTAPEIQTRISVHKRDLARSRR